MEAYIGSIILFAGNFAPRNWAFCDGSLLSIASNTALFSILGTTYGGDGKTTFALPDLRGRVPMHTGTGPGLSPRALGQNGGTETVTLTTAQMPAHGHLAGCLQAQGSTNDPTNAFPAVARDNSADDFGASANKTMNAAFVQSSGGNQPHANVQPFLCINYIIALQGIFPPHN